MRILLITRILPATFFLTVALARLLKLPNLFPLPPSDAGALARATALAQIAYHLSVIFFLLLITVLFISRPQPIRKSAGVRPRLMALFGSFLLTFIAVFPNTEPTLLQTMGATILMVSGSAITIAALLALGRSFSIFPEARRLVTCGPYGIVRHPMYLGEILAGFGLILQAFSGFALLLFVLFLFAQLMRMRYEEQILESTFPEYAAYKRRTARLIPRIY
ncbi:MAG: isoprenylcysteine carboxylmethyltransferase family protein [Blastocatellia bacterium]|nr:isoprenylcysteine carboxylmethyltransferase family protein [Blastocatellia bacterium]MCS7157677.1 isoprenylcysteine carboxylmethyltransferase family protein [Blastocatellia bacterium]MCX7751942.1 isoprenylcysteine carboxylmethyltransferase family protein [Blastocatellia bacterium]MDW8167048.1 isoprenylcysteine carboxylmethyltransferase family protein [Acidobacteriota bacterium]MDW8257152.1 isoprenylcysteine carboxylmethyltransferase family protein [Acidobacteriota bacterium]